MTPEEKIEEDKRSALIEGLSSEDEELLKDVHADSYIGTDDDMSDNYENWLQNLTREEIYSIIF